MARKTLIAGNWKMNETYGESVVLAQEISNGFYDDWADQVEVVVCPPFIDLKPVKTDLDDDTRQVALCAQAHSPAPSAPFPGDISVPTLKEVGCAWCIVGHSERRTLFGETNEDVNKKAKALLAGGLAPIVCVGESLAVRDDGTYLAYVKAQVEAAFAGIDEADARRSVVAYEPIWAIGTGRTATPEQAQEVCAAIRETLAGLYGAEAADAMRVLYGGSMNEGNAGLLLAEADIDGGLIGGASLKAASFIAIVKEAL